LGKCAPEVVVVKVNWFSPLPPAKTEVANYTKNIMPYLSEIAEVTIWTDQAEWDISVEQHARVMRFAPYQIPWEELNRADMSIYQIGNNFLFHGSIWQICQLHPGVIVLHDVRLQDFFLNIYREMWQDKHGYLSLMENLYGNEGVEIGERLWKGELNPEDAAVKYPLTEIAQQYAGAVVVHSQEAFHEIQKNKRCHVAYLRLPYKQLPEPENVHVGSGVIRSARVPYRLIQFGHLGANRRIKSILEALATFPEKDCFRLSIYGTFENEKWLKEIIGRFGLSELVRIKGFVSERDLYRALSESHLAFNLRYPSMGEASGSQLQIWNHALPSLVTKTGWYSEISEEVVGHVRVENEIKDIHRHLKAFLRNPARYAEMGKKGADMLREYHDPKVYAEEIVEFAGMSKEVFRLMTTNRYIERVSSELCRFGSGISSPREITNVVMQIFQLVGERNLS
jgi:glycosyltransferase involved in cell wall biosynthesis